MTTLANADRGDPNAGFKAFLWALWCGSIGCSVNRYKIRKHYGIQGNCCVDCLLYTCGCCWCAAVQEWRHVMQREHGDDKRGFWMAK